MAIEEKEQKIKAFGLFPEELQLEPAYVRELSLNNKFQRTLPLLTAWTGSKQVLLRATSGGQLQVSTVGAVFEKYEVNPTTGVVGFNTINGSTVITEEFSEIMTKIDVVCLDHSIFIEISKDGVTYGDKIQLDPTDVFSETISTKFVRLSNVNTDGSHNGRYQLIGYR